jgi:hypothetical protein
VKLSLPEGFGGLLPSVDAAVQNRVAHCLPALDAYFEQEGFPATEVFVNGVRVASLPRIEGSKTPNNTKASSGRNPKLATSFGKDVTTL